MIQNNLEDRLVPPNPRARARAHPLQPIHPEQLCARRRVTRRASLSQGRRNTEACAHLRADQIPIDGFGYILK
ncbi:hypothetical protein DN745_02885 [Bradymonas sediminis]|uniref:Uncharacterized protein n=1 Tax=Bradymonas sediminis TaxID=1548548 RepID=A0A2Z4FH65_9DELT|nr:hypothetical protein DN745_02885 [Bradymonas sediminis]